MKWDNRAVEGNVKKWNCRVVSLDQNKRHLDVQIFKDCLANFGVHPSSEQMSNLNRNFGEILNYTAEKIDPIYASSKAFQFIESCGQFSKTTLLSLSKL